jgi:hypothetical protein
LNTTFFLFDEPLKGSKSLKTFKISLTFRFDKLWHLSKSFHIGENSRILTMSNKKIFIYLSYVILFLCFWFTLALTLITVKQLRYYRYVYWTKNLYRWYLQILISIIFHIPWKLPNQIFCVGANIFFKNHQKIKLKKRYTSDYAATDRSKLNFRASGRNLVNYRSRNRPETHALPT